MKMVASNILARKQSEKMTNEQLIDIAMKLQDNPISKQTELINDNKEFPEKLNVIKAKFDDLKKENETLQSKFMIAEKALATLSINNEKLNEMEMERNMHRLSSTHVMNASKLQESQAVSQTTFSKNMSF